MTNLQVLLLIATFVTLTLGSFIWYVATWNKDAETGLSVSHAPPSESVVL